MLTRFGGRRGYQFGLREKRGTLCHEQTARTYATNVAVITMPESLHRVSWPLMKIAANSKVLMKFLRHAAYYIMYA